MKRIALTMTMGSLLFGTAMWAQDSTIIHDRKQIQQQRIGNGVKNGSLKPKQTANLENKESKLNKEISTDRKQNGGKLTNQEKKQVNQQQNQLSKQIYKDKHK